jgi:hypothetical protein
MYSQDSVDLLRDAGIDFGRHQVDGIRMEEFGELLTTSGLVVEDRVTWLTFHRWSFCSMIQFSIDHFSVDMISVI